MAVLQKRHFIFSAEKLPKCLNLKAYFIVIYIIATPECLNFISLF